MRPFLVPILLQGVDLGLPEWVIGMVSVLVISSVSLAGAAMLPLFRRNKRAENRWAPSPIQPIRGGKDYWRFFHIFVGLAIATLTADAFLHMIPEVEIPFESSHWLGEGRLPGSGRPRAQGGGRGRRRP